MWSLSLKITGADDLRILRSIEIWYLYAPRPRTVMKPLSPYTEVTEDKGTILPANLLHRFMLYNCFENHILRSVTIVILWQWCLYFYCCIVILKISYNTSFVN